MFIILGIFSLVVVVAFLVVYLCVEKLLYNFPKKDSKFKPSDWGLSYSNIYLKTKDAALLHGWEILHPDKAPTLVFFHGISGSVSLRCHTINLLHKELEVNLVIVDYRGYGQSRGSPSEKSILLDAEAIMQYVRSNPKLNKRVFLMGRSFGGAVATYCASKYQCRGLILENTFTSIPDVLVSKHLKWLTWLVHRNKWNSLERIQKVECPVLFISATKDGLVPPSHMRSLWRASCSETTFVKFT